jgi:hypothetical protein
VRIPTGLLLGLAVIVVGVLFLLDNLGRLEAEEILRYWPVLVILFGLTRLVRFTTPDLVMAAGFIGVGSWLLLYEMDVVGADPWDYVVPFALVVAGSGLAYNAVRPRGEGGDSSSTVSVFAFLSGLERRSSSPDFRHADVTAFMGGCTLDLRHCKIASGAAEVRVSAMWGGVEIRVPKEWIVETRILPFLGGFEDATEQEAADDAPRLVIRGTVVMGGAEIKN